ncbi:MAG: hypothetical protein M0Q38_07540 [Bacteroidales bacterium]|jgi:uncharacterized protein YneF (UPF0154 family)|nr:hypothetical protein [Bacteroidales bacterium]
MSVILRKITACIILALFLFNSMGYFIVFELNKFLVKKEMMAYIRNNPKKLTVLGIDDPDNHSGFRRIGKHEIIHEGRFYDVLHEVKKVKTTLFYCKRDIKEELLSEGFKRMANSKLQHQLLEQIIKIALPYPYVALDNRAAEYFSYPPVSIHLSQVWILPVSPPPKYS